MDTMYLLMKYLHILAVAVWIGGFLALVLLNARMAREGEPAVMAVLGQQSEWFGRMVLGPAMLITLLAGFATAGVIGYSFTSLWILWGIIGFILAIAVGVVGVQRAAAELGTLARGAGPDDPRVASARSRLVALNTIALLILASIVWAMVFKPTF